MFGFEKDDGVLGTDLSGLLEDNHIPKGDGTDTLQTSGWIIDDTPEHFYPDTPDVWDIGKAANRIKDFYIDGGLDFAAAGNMTIEENGTEIGRWSANGLNIGGGADATFPFEVHEADSVGGIPVIAEFKINSSNDTWIRMGHTGGSNDPMIWGQGELDKRGLNIIGQFETVPTGNTEEHKAALTFWAYQGPDTTFGSLTVGNIYSFANATTIGHMMRWDRSVKFTSGSVDPTLDVQQGQFDVYMQPTQEQYIVSHVITDHNTLTNSPIEVSAGSYDADSGAGVTPTLFKSTWQTIVSTTNTATPEGYYSMQVDSRQGLAINESGDVSFGGTTFNSASTNTAIFLRGVAPDGNIADSWQLYSQDIVAGNAAPHIRTEDGSIIKIYQVATYSTSNVSADRTLDADSTSLNELADFVCTMANDLQTLGWFG